MSVCKCWFREEELLLDLLSTAFKNFHLHVKNLTPIFKIAQEKKEGRTQYVFRLQKKDLSSCYDAVKCTIYSWDAGTDWSACTYHTIIHFLAHHYSQLAQERVRLWMRFDLTKPYLLTYRRAAQCLITRQYESEKGELYILAERRRVLWLRQGANLCPGVRLVPGGCVILLPTRIMAIMKLAEMAHCPRRRGAKLAATCLGKAGGRTGSL